MSRKPLGNGPLIAFDFFCGAGGLTRGLLDAGIKVLAGFDSDGKCRRTYEYNNPNVRFVETDIRDLDREKLLEYSRGVPFCDMLFAACAPCQPFSKQAKHGSDRRDATLLGAFGRLIEETLPGQVFIENVPGIARVKGNSTFKRFLRVLKDNAYQYVYDVVDAKRFGVPQTRRRLILLAMSRIRPTMAHPKYGTRMRPYRSVREAISRFPAIVAGESHSEIANHAAAYISSLNMERLIYTPEDGGDRRSWPEYLRLACHIGNYNGHTDVYGRMTWDSPAPTLTGRCNSISNGRYGHPTQNRAISLREAASLQSFQDGYVFFGSNNHIAQQIGNAVPVMLAEAFGRHILSLREVDYLDQ